jgi:hypothetical protein
MHSLTEYPFRILKQIVKISGPDTWCRDNNAVIPVTDDPGLYPSQEMLGREDIPRARQPTMREV